MKCLRILILLFLGTPVFAVNTWYVRTDGGDPTQCDGQHDAAYSVGVASACAFNDLNYVIGFRTSTFYRDPASLRFQSGDTLIIDDVNHADGSRASYLQGKDMPGIVYGVCDQVNSPGGCSWGPIPGGPDAAHPSRILGKQWNAGCKQRPLLWAEAVYSIFNPGGSNIEFNCLDLEGVNRNNVPTPQTPTRTTYGIFADPISSMTDITVRYLEIHGFRNSGIMIGFGAPNHAGPIGDVTIDHTRIYGNAGAGFGTNVPGYGSYIVTNSAVEWSGCYTVYPPVNSNIDDPANYYWCFSQGQYGHAPYAKDQGYGDAIAFGPSGHETSGNWILDHDLVKWNTQDGFDTIHGGLGTGYMNITNSWFEGNAGAAIKLHSTDASIYNNVILANCGFFDSQPFTANTSDGISARFMSCRAGTAVAFPSAPVENFQFYNNTLFSNHTIFITYEGAATNSACTPNTQYHIRNNIFLGGPNWMHNVMNIGDWFFSDVHYQTGCDAAVWDEDYNVAWHIKHSTQFTGAHDHYLDPKIAGTFSAGSSTPMAGGTDSPTDFYQGTNGSAQFYLQPTSPAVGAGEVFANITTDINGYPRSSHPTIGALELGSKVTPAAPIVTSPSTASGVVGQSFSYQIAATNNPTTFSTGVLPDGISVDPMKGLITGTPTSAGTYDITIEATNGVGNGTERITLTINPAGIATTASGSSISAVRVYPNPWRKDRPTGDYVMFDQMPAGSEVKIFTISGHKVRDLSAPRDSVLWDLANAKGQIVASGIYLYVVKDPEGNTARGKLAVIR